MRSWKRCSPLPTRLGLDVDPVKRDGLEDADLQGNAFMSLFSTFGTFSIVAGVLLIFLIFLMLAAERRPELGVAGRWGRVGATWCRCSSSRAWPTTSWRPRWAP